MSGEWDQQQKISWEKDVEDWMVVSVWRVGRIDEGRLIYERSVNAVTFGNG